MNDQAATCYRTIAALASNRARQSKTESISSSGRTSEGEAFEERIVSAVRQGLCPTGWPRFAPERYDEQLRTKAAVCRQVFPEVNGGSEGGAVQLQVLASPRSQHRMRARVGVVGAESADTVGYASAEGGHLERLDIACGAIDAALPLLLEELRHFPVLRIGLACVNFLGVRDGLDPITGRPRHLIICLIYNRPIVDEGGWRAAAAKACRNIGGYDASGDETIIDKHSKDFGTKKQGVSLIGQARGQRLVVGTESVIETYHLKDGRHLSYRHIFGHFSNPNAYACGQSLDFLSSAATSGIAASVRKSCDLLELYCGNGNHTVALAPLFRRALAVEINPALCAVAKENLSRNSIVNASVVRSPSADFCSAVLRRRAWIDKSSGHIFDFGAVLVDPPRAGLDDSTIRLVAKYEQIFYVSCNPFVSLRRDLSALQAKGFELRKMALIDHFPYTPHTECAVHLTRMHQGPGGI